MPATDPARAPSPPLSLLLDHSADALLAVRRGRSLNDVLAETAAKPRPGVQALTFAALRRLGAAEAALSMLAPKAPAPRVAALLWVALALLWPDDTRAYADHTLVDQAVAAARRRTPGAAAFVNAVLRRFLRERDAIVAALQLVPVARWNHPAWWIERLQQDWPASWQALLAAAQRRAPMTLRVNRRQRSGADYVRRLAEAGHDAVLLTAPAFGGQAVQLAQPCAVQDLPGFAAGEVSVQDASAQRAALLLMYGPGGDGGPGGRNALKPGARVLDACAAPGGKSAHLLELADLHLLAVDVDAQRLQRVQGTLQRLQLHGTTAVGDASQPAGWWDGRPFDAVLLDAPCSASGIVRRHPDIRWLRRASDLAALAALQARMLDALWPLVAPGGRLLYATCSVFRCEGQDQIDAFLQHHGGSGAVLDPASPGHLPTVADNWPEGDAASPLHDGFYYALIHKA